MNFIHIDENVVSCTECDKVWNEDDALDAQDVARTHAKFRHGSECGNPQVYGRKAPLRGVATIEGRCDCGYSTSLVTRDHMTKGWQWDSIEARLANHETPGLGY